MGLTPQDLSFTRNMEAWRFSPIVSGKQMDKTVTVRHRETSDREDKQSESHLVMRWIAVAILPQAKAVLTFVWCLMARNFTEPINRGKQMNEDENSSCAPRHTE